jgi:hypothetical protein
VIPVTNARLLNGSLRLSRAWPPRRRRRDLRPADGMRARIVPCEALVPWAVSTLDGLMAATDVTRLPRSSPRRSGQGHRPMSGRGSLTCLRWRRATDSECWPVCSARGPSSLLTVTLPSSVASTTRSEPKLPTRCGGPVLSWALQGLELDGCRRVIPPCTRSSWGVASRPVSNFVSSRIPVPSGRGRLRRSGPPRPGTDRPAGHGEAVTASCKLPLLAHHGVSDLHHSQVPPPRHAGAVRPWRIAGSLARRLAMGDRD